MTMEPGVPGQLSPEEMRRRRKRSIAIAVSLAILVALFYGITMAKLGPQILQRPM